MIPESIEDYLKRNNIRLKHISHATPEQKRIGRIPHHDKLYHELYFKSRLDDFIASVDYDITAEVLKTMLEQTEPYKDILEVGCGSGLLGCFLASHDRKYRGIDMSPAGIQRAKQRAEANGLSPDFFQVQDVVNYTQRHELVIGNCVLNNHSYVPSRPMIEAICNISDNIIMFQQSTFFCGEWPTLDSYKAEFSRMGFSLETSQKYWTSQAMGDYIFLIQARKKD